MGNWSIVVPCAGTNLFLDPQFALADPAWRWTFAGDGTEDFTRESTYQWVGPYSAKADLGGGTWASIVQDYAVTEGAAYTLSCRVRRSAGGVVTGTQVSPHCDHVTGTWDSITSEGNGWYLCVKSVTAAATATTDWGLIAREQNLYIDAMQLEATAYRTTYIDGTQEGCYWSIAPNTSTSVRSGQSRAGGRVIDFDSYTCYVTAWAGAGMPTQQVNTIGRGLLPGEQYVSSHTLARKLVLTLWADGTSASNLHGLRQALIDAIKPDIVYPQQEFAIRYAGASVPKEIWVVYESGLEGGTWEGYTESLSLGLRASDPFWYSLYNTAVALDETDAGACGILIARRSGAWEQFGPPGTGGGATYSHLHAITVGTDGKVYVGGEFHNMDAIADGDHVALWNPVTSAWAAMGSGCTAPVLALAEDNIGDIWAGGTFTGMGGIADTACLAVWDISGSVWTSVGSVVDGGVSPDVRAILKTKSGANKGRIYIGGTFDHVGAVGADPGVAAENIAYYDGTWHAIGAGTDDTVDCLTEDSAGNIYVGGQFTAAGGLAANYVAKVTQAGVWSLLTAAGLSDECLALAIGSSGYLYAGGAFHTAGGVTVNHVAKWNGTAWSAMSGGVNAEVWSLAWSASANLLYVGGTFTTAGSLGLADGIATWNGTTWKQFDLDFTGAVNVYALYVRSTYSGYGDLYIGSDAASLASSGTVTITNAGTASAWPVLTFYRSGGTSAKLYSVSNRETGHDLLFNYDMSDGETLTVDLRPGYKTVMSDFHGNKIGEVQPGSDFASWCLLPGTNRITTLIITVGSPTITAFCRWQNTYWSVD